MACFNHPPLCWAHTMHANTGVDVWLIDMDDPGLRAGCDRRWLSRSESGCIQACGGFRSCSQFALVRCLIRRLAADALSCLPGDIPLGNPLPGEGVPLPGGKHVAWVRDNRWLVVALGAVDAFGIALSARAAHDTPRWLRRRLVSCQEAEWLSQLPRGQRADALARIRALKLAWTRSVPGDRDPDLSGFSVMDRVGQCPPSLGADDPCWFLTEGAGPASSHSIGIAGRARGHGMPQLRWRRLPAPDGDVGFSEGASRAFSDPEPVLSRRL